jgi:hypothetical protein
VSDPVVDPSIEGPPPPAARARPPAAPTIGVGARSYDLFDDPADVENRWPLLRGVLHTCERVVGQAYARSDQLAWFFQKPHNWVTAAGALMGTAAVLFAIFQLAFPELVERSLLPVLEVVSAVTAVTFVVVASVVALKFRWLVQRHQSERLRFAKFRFLIDPETWSGDVRRAARVQQLEDEVRAIQQVTYHEFREWAEGAVQPVEPPAELTFTLPEGAPLDQLIDYYRTKRLNFQRFYFADRVRRFGPMDVLTRWVVPSLFYGSVFFVLVHYAYDHWEQGAGLSETSRLMIFLAASLPAVAGGLRTLRAAHEFSRNRTRYRAAALTLAHLDEILMRPKMPEDKLRDMGFCEQTLDLEHREWGRLMIESEIMP